MIFITLAKRPVIMLLVILLLFSVSTIFYQSSVYGDFYPAHVPDLTIKDILWLPDNPREGENLTIITYIENIVNSSIKEDFTCKLFIEGIREPFSWSYSFSDGSQFKFHEVREKIINIDPQINYLKKGSHKVVGYVDTDNRVPEVNEVNNSLEKILDIEPKLNISTTTNIVNTESEKATPIETQTSQTIWVTATAYQFIYILSLLIVGAVIVLALDDRARARNKLREASKTIERENK